MNDLCICEHDENKHARNADGCLPCSQCECDDFFPSVEGEFV